MDGLLWVFAGCLLICGMIHKNFVWYFKGMMSVFSKIWWTSNSQHNKILHQEFSQFFSQFSLRFMSCAWWMLMPFYRWNEGTDSEPIASPPFLMVTRVQPMLQEISSWRKLLRNSWKKLRGWNKLINWLKMVECDWAASAARYRQRPLMAMWVLMLSPIQIHCL